MTYNNGPQLHSPPPVSTDFSRAPWMTTFVDTTALILTFFVLLFSMSSVHSSQWKVVSESLGKNRDQVTVNEGRKSSGNDTRSLSVFRKYAINLDYLKNIIDNKINSTESLKGVTTLSTEDRIIISLPGDLLFPSGSDVLTDRARRSLLNLSEVLVNIRNRIDVEGHTDPNPISTDLFQNNWELSLARAMRVSDQLQAFGFRRTITAHGLGDSRFGDLPPGAAKSDRYAGARRVDIVIYGDEGK